MTTSEEFPALVVGQTYERDLINVLFGVPAECECRIVAFDENGEHHCGAE